MSKRDSVVCRVILLALLTAAFAPQIVSAQQVYGSIYGTVVDPTGSAVPKVKVTITDQAKANFKDGVLEITMPAPPEQVRRGRRLEIAEAASTKK